MKSALGSRTSGSHITYWWAWTVTMRRATRAMRARSLVVVTGLRRVICGAAVTFGLVLAWWLAWTLL